MMRKNRRGLLAFEWLIIVTLLVIGMIGGLGVLRAKLYTTCDVMPQNVSNMNQGFISTP